MIETEVLDIDAVGRDFDVAQVEKYVEGLPFTMRDEQDPHTFMVGDDDMVLRAARHERKQIAPRYPLMVTLVKATSKRVHISWKIGSLPQARDLAKWLRESYEVKMLDEKGRDITAQLDEDLSQIFDED
jgi:hypothetical protein